MKAALLFVFNVAAHIASAVPIAEDGLVEKTYPRYIEMPDGDGNLHTMDLEAEPNMELLEDFQRNPEQTLYILFTRRNSVGQILFMNNAESVLNSNFNPNVPTKVIVHGALSNQNTEPNPTLRHVFLSKSDVNVIVMDWHRLAFADYITAITGIPAVGAGLGLFMQFLHRATGARYDQMHLIGFSLGAHVVGNAGRQLNGQIARITGLDPAGPLWYTNVNRLRPTDGVYVEAIHTDSAGLGIGLAIARADFFPNGGILQPGCWTTMCHHDRAWQLFAASITYNHLIGRQCATALQVNWNTCTGPELRLGNDDLQKWGSGMYRVNTGANYPY